LTGHLGLPPGDAISRPHWPTRLLARKTKSAGRGRGGRPVRSEDTFKTLFVVWYSYKLTLVQPEGDIDI
jgi:hypothetical protein